MYLDESSHLVDLGCGYPFFEAIPLHRLPQYYFQAGLEYQLQMVDGHYARLHKRGDTVPKGEVIFFVIKKMLSKNQFAKTSSEILIFLKFQNSVMVGEWRKVFHFQTVARNLEYFPAFMKQVYTEDNSFHQAIVSVRFPESELCLMAVRGNELLTMKTLTTINDCAKMEHAPINNLTAVFQDHFPHIPLEFVQRAITQLAHKKQQ